MLERAKACLQSGARESLRCARPDYRSKRMLHSTFWNHGAGDLELLPWALPTTSMPPHLSAKHNAIRPGDDSRRLTAEGHNSNDDFFLEFLYPPQALAMLSRANAKQWERWQRRNARRLPDGFVQTSRGYASRACTPLRTTRIGKPRQQERGYRRGEATEKFGMSKGGTSKRDTGSGINSSSDPREQSEQDATARPDTDTQGSQTQWFDSPGDIAEGHVASDDVQYVPPNKKVLQSEGAAPPDSDTSKSRSDDMEAPDDLFELAMDGDQTIEMPSAHDDPSMHSAADVDLENAQPVDELEYLTQQDADRISPRERIMSMMQFSRRNRSRGKSEKDLQSALRVLRFHDEVADQDADIDFRRELLAWFSVYPNEETEARCLDLYLALTTEQRTLPVYRAALAVYLRRRQATHAFALLGQALGNLDNADQVAVDLFAFAADRHRWRLATQVETAYCRSRGTVDESERRSMFWSQISAIPNLLPRALRLAEDTARHHAQGKDTGFISQFLASLSREALIQEFETSRDDGEQKSFSRENILPTASICKLFEQLEPWLEDAPRFYERMMAAMIRSSPPYSYEQVHGVVAFAYQQLRRKFQGYKIATETLLVLLERVRRYHSSMDEEKFPPTDFTTETIANDWIKFYGKLSKTALTKILTYYANRGQVDKLTTWLEHLGVHWPTYDAQKSVLWTAIYVHARRIDLPKAKAAFDAIYALAAEHGQLPEPRCWSVLLHAYARQDDLEGATAVFLQLTEKGVVPHSSDFHSLMTMHAKRGDAESVRDLLVQYDVVTGRKRETHMYGALLVALDNSGDLYAVEEVLETIIEEVKSGRVLGSLTNCFNIMVRAHAFRRNMDAAMDTYRRMMSEGVPVDGDTFAALMQSLTLCRKTDAAHKILNQVMDEHGVRPKALHYAIIMAGYVMQGRPALALKAHTDMKRRKIGSTVNSNAAYMRARTMKEHLENTDTASHSRDTAPLKRTVALLRKLLEASDGTELAAKEPDYGRGTIDDPSQSLSAYVDPLILVHGHRHCIEAAKELYNTWKEEARRRGSYFDERQPIKIMAALMSACLRAGEYEEVERYWQLAKEQADDFAKNVMVPPLVDLPTSHATDPDLMDIQPATSSQAQEAGFSIEGPLATPSRPRRKLSSESELLESKPSAIGKGRAYVLDRPFRFYMHALAKQARLQELLALVSQLLNQGYVLDNRTWNVLISTLCEAQPPLVLLAFVLCERFLISSFPGWAVPGTYLPNKSAREEKMQYILARYLPPGKLMPQYMTLVKLGSALLRLRNLQARGGRTGAMGKGKQGLDKYVGTLSQVRLMAPKTMLAVQSMPIVDDRLQNQLLRGDPAAYYEE